MWWWILSAYGIALAFEVHRFAIIDQLEADKDTSRQEWWPSEEL